MSGNNGNGNGHREYERADTPPSDRFLPDLALNYGWDKVPGPEVKYIQTLGHKHNAKHRDYSQVTMLIFP